MKFLTLNNLKKLTIYLSALLVIYQVYIVFLTKRKLISKKVLGSTISVEQAKQKAELLYSSMNRLGTDEDAIFLVFKNLKEPDFNLIYNEFGLRGYTQELGYQIGFGIDEKFDLLQWMSNELSANDLEKLMENIRM